MSFVFIKLEIPEVILIKPKLFKDDRGYFIEIYKASDFKMHGIDINFVQDNHSFSKAGIIRGLHFQRNPNAQGKLVRVMQGKVFDVVVDIREGSPTYGKWVSTILSGKNHAMVWVPMGFAHGICVLEDAHVLYKLSGAEYNEMDYRSILWNDPKIHVKWPIQDPDLSAKDCMAKSLHDIDNNFIYDWTLNKEDQ